MKRLTIEQFIEKARIVHGDYYDYSLVEYVNAKTKIKIICPIHGIFEQISNSHLRNSGCYTCGRKKANESRKLTTEQFIEKAKKVHGAKYDYSFTKYDGGSEYLDIKCPIHGLFIQKATKHLSGNNCKQCANDLLRLDTKTFIKKCKEKYSEYNYDYSKTEYIDCFTELIITCPKHGDFITNSHKFYSKGRICKQCVNRTSSKPEKIWLDYLNIPLENRNVYINIGEKQLCVDGIDYKNNIIYEFYGDYFHGNPEVYKKNEINKRLNKTFGELFLKTKSKEKYIKKNSDFKLVTMWEKEFKNKNKNKNREI